jgi:hypothetical protein
MLVAGSNSGFLEQFLYCSTGLLTAGSKQRSSGNQDALVTGFDICDQVSQRCPEQPFGPVSVDRVAYRPACSYRKSGNRTIPSFDYQNKKRVGICFSGSPHPGDLDCAC